MTRKDFVMLAQTLRLVRPDPVFRDMRQQWCTDMLAVATAIKAQNQAFERDRFVVDCGAEDCDRVTLD